MAGYSPLKITGPSTGLVQERENFLLPDDGYPKLQNAYVWRERIKRKQGCLLLGRLRRNLATQSLGNTIATGIQFNLFTLIHRTGTITGITQANPGEVTTGANHLLENNQFVTLSGVGGMVEVNNKTYKITVTAANKFTIGVDTTTYTAYTAGGNWETDNTSLETKKTIVPGTVIITMPGPIVFTDQGNGTLTSVTPGNSGVINYISGNITLTTTAGAGTSFVTFSYYPSLPVMGIRTRELQNSLNDQTVFFDQVYAYIFNGGTNQFQEFIPGTTWNMAAEGIDGVSFFWSTNYWVSQPIIPGTTKPLFTTSNVKLFWETNNTGQFGANQDPPRITDGVTWVNFYDDSAPLTFSPWAQIGFNDIPAPIYLTNFLSMLPFRGRLVTFNTWEGISAASSANFSNRIRWSTIGNPFIPYDNGPPAKGSWRDDIRGQGGFLDIPTSEDIVSIGFVRDNLVIYCERSTWQLRYTGRSIAPFQIERVNSELGGEGPFSAVQFDTSLVGIGDKGIVECDSYKSERMDIKILDFVFEIQNANNGDVRVHGIRNFIKRLAYWTIPLSSEYDAMLPAASRLYPNIRLIYNYENDSWAAFDDTYTALGTFQPQSSRTWLTTPIPWIQCNFSWIGTQARAQPDIVGGNQQGFIEYLDQQTVNDVSLAITDIQANTTIPTVITSPNHNLKTGSVIGIRGIIASSPYDSLNDGIYGVVLGDNSNADPANKFRLMLFDPATGEFSMPQLDVPSGTYLGGGLIYIRDNFSIVSKKFNFLDEGQSIQLGYLDILMDATELGQPGAISLNVYLDYNDVEPSNTLPNNTLLNYAPPGVPDTFFNSVIPTTPSDLNNVGGTKFWQRVFCPTRANFLTLEYTFSNAQMAGEEQTKDVQIDAQILWIRRAGRMTSI
ncbi:Ubiquitin-activating enzyme E1, FCCH domain containing protein [uncultured Caudovirales phage]|uniref:Ubiquitin-activating enzyme E1, FCCH domain containing protein n=1 Tax=uncultured Caudovirales phage TaxID=2100421 RepID=A0A6J5LGE5_9CAUD|nr:Ubiquitin-activating enzyme E1, FCCH domain containing protein [uncultured Caudovirales phage]